jgi:bifunctional UDP-N-acetylglucosamine pyrophosphorylase/glucosamine-1-phosphate N-acetyltransferase
MNAPQRHLDAIILAAGKGTRMGSDLAKVLHPVADRAMVHWVVDACEAVGVRRNIVVVGHQADVVRATLKDRRSCRFVDQTQQFGTGHAVMMAQPLFDSKAGPAAGGMDDVDVLVLCGDGPLIQPGTLARLLERHRSTGAVATLATAVLDDPTGYGRIVRDSAGRFERIVEQKDATEIQRSIREVNPSYYCFQARPLFDALSRTDNRNANGEYYITDVLGVFVREGRLVEVIDAVEPEDVLSINNPAQLAMVDSILRRRIGMEVRA